MKNCTGRGYPAGKVTDRRRACKCEQSWRNPEAQGSETMPQVVERWWAGTAQLTRSAAWRGTAQRAQRSTQGSAHTVALQPDAACVAQRALGKVVPPPARRLAGAAVHAGNGPRLLRLRYTHSQALQVSQT